VIFIYKRQAHQMTRLRLKWCRGAESNRAAEYYPGLANARMFPVLFFMLKRRMSRKPTRDIALPCPVWID